MSHKVMLKLTRTQAEAACEALEMVLEDDPADEQAEAALRKLNAALDRRAVARNQPRGRFQPSYPTCVCGATMHSVDCRSRGHLRGPTPAQPLPGTISWLDEMERQHQKAEGDLNRLRADLEALTPASDALSAPETGQESAARVDGRGEG